MKNKLKKYEVNGVLDYAHCFSVEVEAKSPTDAQKIVKAKLASMSNPAIAEFQGGIVDRGILIKIN
jgi:hypothetical protein